MTFTLFGGVCLCHSRPPEEVSNGSVSLCFSSDSGALTGFAAAGHGNLLGPVADTADLWRAELEVNGHALEIGSSQAGSFRFAPSGDSLGRVLRWSGFHGLDDLSVEARVTLTGGRPDTRWNIRVHGLGGARLINMRFPIIAGVAPAAGESFAVPAWMGQAIAEPRRLFSATNASHSTSWSYPGHLSMQCAALCVSNGVGIYTACDDAMAYRKDLRLTGDTSGNLGLEWIHFPEQGGRGTDIWTLPYDAILTPHRGGWFEAAEIYRGWATNQRWAVTSRLASGEIPPWATGTAIWVWNRGRSPEVIGPALHLQHSFALPVSVFWHWWHGCAYDAGFPEYLPPREGSQKFSRAVASAGREGVHALVYMNQRLWGMETMSWKNRGAQRFAVKQRDGSIRSEVYNTFTKSPCASMCMGTAFWRNTYAEIAERAILQLDVSGIYMDQACTSLSCYDPTHGHPVGGGKYWIEGFQTLAQDIRRRANGMRGSEVRGATALLAQPRQVALAGEGVGEAWLPYLDLMLSLQVSKERYAGDDGWETIPFFHAVYHPYFVPFGNYSSLTMPPYDDLWPKASSPEHPMELLDEKYSAQFLLEQARAFVWGQQPTIANFQPAQLKSRAMELDYVHRLAAVRQKALPYLLEGAMEPPPDFDSPEKVIDFSRLSIYAGQQRGIREFQKAVKAVLAAQWKSRDGTRAFAIASIAPEPVTVKLQVPPALRVGPMMRVVRIDEFGRHEPSLQELSAITLTLGPRDACVVELLPP